MKYLYVSKWVRQDLNLRCSPGGSPVYSRRASAACIPTRSCLRVRTPTAHGVHPFNARTTAVRSSFTTTDKGCCKTTRGSAQQRNSQRVEVRVRRLARPAADAWHVRRSPAQFRSYQPDSPASRLLTADACRCLSGHGSNWCGRATTLQEEYRSQPRTDQAK